MLSALIGMEGLECQKFFDVFLHASGKKVVGMSYLSMLHPRCGHHDLRNFNLNIVSILYCITIQYCSLCQITVTDEEMTPINKPNWRFSMCRINMVFEIILNGDKIDISDTCYNWIRSYNGSQLISGFADIFRSNFFIAYHLYFVEII